MLTKIKDYFKRLLLAEGSTKRLAASFSLGTFIALSPTIPFQTPLIFILSWAFRLNVAVTFTACYLVNNPFTLVPIYVADYLFGVWLFNTVLGLQLERYNPSWVRAFNTFLAKYIDLAKYTGNEFCFWCLILGGLIIGIAGALIVYPPLKLLLDRLKREVQDESNSNE